MIVLLAALAVIAVDLIVRLVLRRNAGGRVRPAGSGPLRWLRVAVNTIAFASLIAMAATAVVSDRASLTGNRLIWHVASAPAFALAAVAITLLWAHRSRFAAGDWRRFASPGTWAVPLRKFFFWAAVLLALPTLLSILAAMFPLFDTEGQQDLLGIHRVCGPLLAGTGLLFGYFALVSWIEGSKD